MKITTIKDVMVPLEQYATVAEDATLYEAVTALDEAQKKIDHERHPHLHRAILVFGKNHKIVGKISQLDVLRALEPKYAEMGDYRSLSLAGFSPQFLKSMLKQNALWEAPLKDICSKAANLKVKDCMHTPTKGEYVEETAPLEEGLNLLVVGHHQSLLVTRDDDIVGVLRLTDVFNEVFKIMKICRA